MVRFVARRLLLSLITLWLLATIVFVIANVLPNDVGRTILGPFAPQAAVDQLNQRLGTDRPLLVRYVDSMRGLVTLNFGNSFVSGQAVLPQLLGAVGRSAKLAGLALLITIPISIVAGLFAARRRDRLADRAIVLLGVTSSSIPEFVTGTILVVVVAVQIGYLFGGIIAVERIFNYNGMGQAMLFAAQHKDLPMLTAGVVVIGIVYMLATLGADVIIAWMNPRIRMGADR